MRRNSSKYLWAMELPRKRRRETYKVRWVHQLRERRKAAGLTIDGKPRTNKPYVRYHELDDLPPLERSRERKRRWRQRNVEAGLTGKGTALKVHRHGWAGLSKAEWNKRWKEWRQSALTPMEKAYREFRAGLNVCVHTFDDIPVGGYAF